MTHSQLWEGEGEGGRAESEERGEGEGRGRVGWWDDGMKRADMGFHSNTYIHLYMYMYMYSRYIQVVHLYM